VSNSREEYPNRCWPTLRFHYGPRPGAIRTPSGHAEHSAPLLMRLPSPVPSLPSPPPAVSRGPLLLAPSMSRPPGPRGSPEQC
jgi:hypothetical protein